MKHTNVLFVTSLFVAFFFPMRFSCSQLVARKLTNDMEDIRALIDVVCFHVQSFVQGVRVQFDLLYQFWLFALVSVSFLPISVDASNRYDFFLFCLPHRRYQIPRET